MSSNTTLPLYYAPPQMNNPTVIDLNTTGSQTSWSFSSTQDVIFLGSSSVDHNQKLQVSGGHNIEVLGGDFTPTVTGATGTLAFYGATGTVYIDGVHIDNANVSGTDGIDIAGAGGHTGLTVQNSSIVNVNGAVGGHQSSNSNGHADGIQIQGNMGGEVNLANLHVTTNYQGLFLAPQYSIAPSAAHLTNVDLSYTGPSNDGKTTSYLLWSLDAASEKPYPFSFDNVHVQPRAGQDVSAGNTVWPDSGNGGALHPTISGNQVSWPGLPYSGHVTVGAPAQPVVNEGLIGTHFADASAIVSASTGGGALALAGSGTGSTVTTSTATATTSPTTTSAPTTATATTTTTTSTTTTSTATAAPTAGSSPAAAASGHGIDLQSSLHSAQLDLSKLMHSAVADSAHAVTVNIASAGADLHLAATDSAGGTAAAEVHLGTLSTLFDLTHQLHHS